MYNTSCDSDETTNKTGRMAWPVSDISVLHETDTNSYSIHHMFKVKCGPWSLLPSTPLGADMAVSGNFAVVERVVTWYYKYSVSHYSELERVTRNVLTIHKCGLTCRCPRADSRRSASIAPPLLSSANVDIMANLPRLCTRFRISYSLQRLCCTTMKPGPP